MIVVTVILALAFCGGLSSASIIESRLTPGNTTRFLYSNFGVLFFLYYFISLCALALTVLPPNKFPDIIAQTTATVSIIMSTIFTAVAAWLLRPQSSHRGKKPLKVVDLDLELTRLQANLSEWLERHKDPISANVPLLRWQLADIVTTVGACVMEDRMLELLDTAIEIGSPKLTTLDKKSSTDSLGRRCRKIHESSTCCICLEGISYYDSDIAVLARCGHAFHFGCLESWLRIRNQCAVCRLVAV